MVKFSLVLLSFFLGFFSLPLEAKDISQTLSELGERKLNDYYEKYSPIVRLDEHQGRLFFEDTYFFENYFDAYAFEQTNEILEFLKSEMSANFMCTDNQLANHFDQIRFSYRLITLSYIIESLEHMRNIGTQLKLKSSCDEKVMSVLPRCVPKTIEMKKYVSLLESNFPDHSSEIPRNYSLDKWLSEIRNESLNYYSQYKLRSRCLKNCTSQDLEQKFHEICNTQKKLFEIICSENDEIYGLSKHREAFSLLGSSQIINTFNHENEATGCLRRFSLANSFKEVHYPGLDHLFLVIQDFLKNNFKERHLQGRSFFLGALKEFEERGLKDLVVQSKKFEVLPSKEDVEVEKPKDVTLVKVEENKANLTKKVFITEADTSQQVIKREVEEIQKSAFLLAAEIRKLQNLETIEVDMLKFKYDYVFNLNTLNKLSKRLKIFMTRDALKEMVKFDGLGSPKGPVPLVFLKYMIDMQEHQGLWNLISTVGEEFFVSNEIDSIFKPSIEKIKLINSPLSEGGWQIHVVSP